MKEKFLYLFLAVFVSEAFTQAQSIPYVSPNTPLWGIKRYMIYLKPEVDSILKRKADTGSIAQFSGNYNDLTNKPVLFSGGYADLTGKPTLFSGAYADLTGKPTLFSGDYSELSNKPTIPTNNNQLTNGSNFITAAGAPVQSVNGQTGAVTINVPTQNTYTAGYGLVKSGTEPSASFRLDTSNVMTRDRANGDISNIGNELNGKVPNSRTLTIAGTTQDLSANRTYTINTTNVSEGSNLYYTDGRARGSISLTTTGSGAATYNSSTGVLNVPTPTGFTRGTGTVVANAVTINASRGQITYAANIIAAGTASITFTNNTVTATSNIQLTINGLGNTLGVMPAVYIKSQGAGTCVIDIRNLNLLSLLNTTFAIDFTVQN